MYFSKEYTDGIESIIFIDRRVEKFSPYDAKYTTVIITHKSRNILGFKKKTKYKFQWDHADIGGNSYRFIKPITLEYIMQVAQLLGELKKQDKK